MEYQNKLYIDVNKSRVFRNELQLDGTVKKKGFLTFIDFLYIIPAYASEEFITFGSTVKTKNDFNILIAVTLDYKKGLSFLIESENGKFGTIKEDNMTYLESFISLYNNVIKPLLLSQTNQQLVDEFTAIINALYLDLDDRRIKSWLPELPVETEPKFKIGDVLEYKASKYPKFTVVASWKSPTTNSFMYDIEYFENLDKKSSMEREEELNLAPDFFQINFEPDFDEWNDTTKKISNVFKTSNPLIEYSDKVKGIKSILSLNTGNMFKTAPIDFFILFTPSSVNNNETMITIGTYDDITTPTFKGVLKSKPLKDELNLSQISNELNSLFKLFIEDLSKEFELNSSTDCEADASLIVSGQVKKFYDLNKTRIEKLKTEFSCKIVKALVSLSEYEKCGKPSKIKLPKPKDDLLSEIKNLKF